MYPYFVISFFLALTATTAGAQCYEFVAGKGASSIRVTANISRPPVPTIEQNGNTAIYEMKRSDGNIVAYYRRGFTQIAPNIRIKISRIAGGRFSIYGSGPGVSFTVSYGPRSDTPDIYAMRSLFPTLDLPTTLPPITGASGVIEQSSITSVSTTCYDPTSDKRDSLPITSSPEIDIFIGGFFDGTASRNVEQYSNQFRDMVNNNRLLRVVKYYHHDDVFEIQKFINGVPLDNKVNLIGHSFGGDAAAYVAAMSSRPINLLITIDPVTRPQQDYPTQQNKKNQQLDREPIPDWYYPRIKASTKLWIDVNATGNSSFEASNVLAGLGGAWNEKPNHHADTYFPQPMAAHRDFGMMMENLGPSGETAPVNVLLNH